MTYRDRSMDMMKKIWKWLLLVLGVAVILIGVPVLINECYKVGDGYMTIWNAQDVLSYYGTVVGAVIAVATIAITISFNRMQIRRDGYMKTETDRWTKIEEEVAKALDRINPQRLMLVNAKGLKYSVKERPNYAVSEIQQYQMDCRVALDQVNFYLTKTDYMKLKPLLDAIFSASEEFFEIAKQECELYTRIPMITGREAAAGLLKAEQNFPNTYSEEEISYASNVLKETNGVTLENVMKEIGQQNEKLVELYDTRYRSISQLRCKIFNEIYAEIQANADQILRFGGKR